MKENSNYSKINKIFNDNNGYITREDIDNYNIPSWFLTDFVRKNNLVKIAPGYYAKESFFEDQFYILQRRYPKYVFSDLTALYIHHLTDKIPAEINVVAPQGYNPSRNKIANLHIRRISDMNIYNLGIVEANTAFGNKVKVYDKERTICDLIKHRDKYDGETFIKAIKYYVRKENNQTKLFEYARIMNIEKKVFDVIELIINDD